MASLHMLHIVKEEITPRGDGNTKGIVHNPNRLEVKEEITPRGDGNRRRLTIL